MFFVRDFRILFDLVMPGLVPGIHVVFLGAQDVDGRDKPGHDALGNDRAYENA
jgi:hypothetical protein